MSKTRLIDIRYRSRERGGDGQRITVKKKQLYIERKRESKEREKVRKERK